MNLAKNCTICGNVHRQAGYWCQNCLRAATKGTVCERRNHLAMLKVQQIRTLSPDEQKEMESLSEVLRSSENLEAFKLGKPMVHTAGGREDH